MSATVLIAAPEHLPALKVHHDFNGAMAFPDSDAVRALDAITRERPHVVALERLFAASARGTALINRIRADPALTSCEIRIVAHDGAGPSGAGVNRAAAAAAVLLPASGAAALLDEHGTRRAPRFAIDGLEILIDGNAAAVIDLSMVGAQVVSAFTLRPSQRVRVSLPAEGRALRFGGGIVWATFEIPKDGPRYRAGVEFFGADTAAIDRVIQANRKT